MVKFRGTARYRTSRLEDAAERARYVVLVDTSQDATAFDADEEFIGRAKQEDGSPFNYVGSEFIDRDPAGGMTIGDVEAMLRGFPDIAAKVMAAASVAADTQRSLPH